MFGILDLFCHGQSEKSIPVLQSAGGIDLTKLGNCLGREAFRGFKRSGELNMKEKES